MKSIRRIAFPPPFYPQEQWDNYTIQLYYSRVDETPQPCGDLASSGSGRIQPNPPTLSRPVDNIHKR